MKVKRNVVVVTFSHEKLQALSHACVSQLSQGSYFMHVDQINAYNFVMSAHNYDQWWTLYGPPSKDVTLIPFDGKKQYKAWCPEHPELHGRFMEIVK